MAWGLRLGGRWANAILGVAALAAAGGIVATALVGFLGGSPVVSTPGNILFVGILLTVASPFIAIGIVFLALRRRDVIQEVFLVSRSGLLLVHFSRTLRPEKDRDIVVAMLTALQSFVQEAFSGTAPRELRRMEFGNREILIRKGTVCYLAVVLQGRPALSLRPRMRRTLLLVEETYRAALVAWDGNTDLLEGADDLIRESLLAGGVRGLEETLRAVGTSVRARIASIHQAEAEPEPPAEASDVDPQSEAARLLARPELQQLRPGSRDMMAAALEEIEKGRLTLVGIANVQMTLALQKVQRPSLEVWWDATLSTFRDVLRTWPWNAERQAWIREGVALPPPGSPEASASLQLPAKLPTLPLDTWDRASWPRTTVGATSRRRRSDSSGSAETRSQRSSEP